MRLDLFLKQTCLVKRRTIAKELAEKGRIFVNEKISKPSYDVKTGDIIKLILGNRIITCTASFEVKGTKEIPSVRDTNIEKND